MATFQAKIGWKSPRKSENKNYRSVPLLPDAWQKIPKKIAKKFKKLKNSVMALYQAKVGRKRPGKRENRNHRSVPFPLDA